MKKSDDLANAFLLKHYPGRSRISASMPTEVCLRNRSLIAITALILAIATSVILFQRTQHSLHQEKQARLDAEQRLSVAEQELGRIQKIRDISASQAAGVARAVQDVAATAEGSQKEFLSRLVPEAIQAQIDKGVPASLLVAIAIKESNYGEAELSRSANNLFSFRASEGEWTGQTWTLTPKDKKKKTEPVVYRLYPDIPSSIRDYASSLQTRMQAQQVAPGNDLPTWLEVTSGTRGDDRIAWQSSVQALVDKHQLQKLDNAELLVSIPGAASSGVAGGQQGVPWEKGE